MNESAQPRQTCKTFARTAESIALVVAVATSVALVSWVIWRAGYGYDFSDEGNYLNWISNPHLYKASVTQYGFVYHPLYRLVDGNIVLLRRLCILITLALGWLLSFVTLRKFAFPENSSHRSPIFPYAVIALTLSTSTLALLQIWVPTPSYNSLTLQALLIAGTGMVLAERNLSSSSQIGWLLIGISGWLAFMAKPTSGLALSVVMGAYIILSRKLSLRMLTLSILTSVALVASTAWLIDDSLEAFVQRIATGAEDAKLLNGGHTLSEALRWDDYFLGRDEKIALVAASLCVFLAIRLSFSVQWLRRLGATLTTISIAVISLLVMSKKVNLPLETTQFFGLQYGSIPLGVTLTVLALPRKPLLSQPYLARWLLAIGFACFPYIYAFGTNNNYWLTGSSAAIFWVLAGLVLLDPSRLADTPWRVFLPVAVAAQVLTTAMLCVSMDHPFRQTQPLSENTDAVQIGCADSTIRISHEFAAYVASLRKLTQMAGFRLGEPMLDLTGHYPGVLYALDAESVGRPWMIGGYQGSEDLAVASLDRVSRETLVKAWILTEPAGPRKLSSEILKRYGIDLEKNYTEVGAVDSPKGEYPNSFKQRLFKPAR